jgi:hypothetical protein
LARSSTPDWDSANAAAILPGVPLPDWAISDGPYIPELNGPEVAAPAPAALPPAAPIQGTLDAEDLSIALPAALRGDDRPLDELSIAEMEAAFREMVNRTVPRPTPTVPADYEPTVSAELAAESDEEPTPVEFARPGYPQTTGVPQVPMPMDLPGYPTDAATGAIIVPPPPPAPAPAPVRVEPAMNLDTSPQAGTETGYEPIRLDLPMSAVLAREFTRTSRSSHDVIVPHVASAAAVVTAAVVAAPVVAVQTLPTQAPAALPTEVPEALQTEVAPAKPGSSNKRLLALIGIGALLALLAALAAFFLPGILNPTETPTPINPSAGQNPTGTTTATSGFVLATPKTIGEYTKLSGPIDSSLHEATIASVIPGLISPMSAVYGKGEVPYATVIAWKASSTPAPSSVSQAFAGFQSSAKTSVADIAGVSSTGLPGQMSCGQTQINGTPTTLCFWADPATFGSITVVNPKTPAQGALTAAQVRSAIEVQQ